MSKTVANERLPRTYAFVSLGCPKNLVDSERMLGKLAQEGMALVPDADGADVVVVNTCGFIEPARQESLGVIREMLDLKRQGRVGAVVVAGCLAERKKEDLLQEIPEVDQIVGVFGREEISNVVNAALGSKKLKRGNIVAEQRSLFRPAPVRAQEDTARLRITPRHYAYLKISEGCDRLCTFCAIPGMRGKHVSKPIEEVLREARELANDGVRELIIVAQDTTFYGLDLYGEVRLAPLLRELQGVDGIEWIRLLYTYPIYFTDELIETLADSKKIVPYLDLPLQHINDRVLKRMQRKVNRDGTEKLLAQLRSAISDLTIRTTFIVGFPGETEREFEELADFVRSSQFERAGVFPYSLEPGTPAARLDAHLPEAVKSERRNRLMEAQQQVAFDWSRKQVGRELAAIIDGPDPEMPSQLLARGHADAPDIDALIRVKGKNLHGGDFVKVKVTGADGYDLARVPSAPDGKFMTTATTNRPPVFNLPNQLTASRLVLSFVLFGLIAAEFWRWCVIVFAIAAVTDWLDGYLARKQGLTSAIGRVFDPLVDKVLICGAYIFLLGIAERTGLVLWMVTVVVARELIITGMRSFFENQSVTFGADWLGKVKMVLQCAALIAVFVVLHLLDIQVSDSTSSFFTHLRDGLIYAMIGATALSGLQYVWKAAFLLREPA